MDLAKLHEEIASDEGCSLTAYPDPGSPLASACKIAGIKLVDYRQLADWQSYKGDPWTIGYGHTSAAGAPAVAGRDVDKELQTKIAGPFTVAAVGDIMIDMMQRDSKVVACTAAMPDGTGISKALAKFPDRSWDVGICESHALDMMAGLAKTGARPFFAVYSTFMQRAFDQAFQEVSLQGLAVAPVI
jgi:hypothetical protein